MRSYAYAGHGSWVVVVILVVTIAMRMGMRNRRRQGAPRPPAQAPGFHADPTVPPAGGPPGAAAPTAPDTWHPAPAPDGARPAGPIGSSGVAAGWLVDPTGRHELRYWSGTAWTAHVSDGGVPATDDPPR
jgi:hypothetical protein